MNHYLPEALSKGTGAPFFTPNSGDTGGIYSGETGGSQQNEGSVGPRGGQIKSISPDTGRPIYFKKWSGGQGYQTHDVIDPSAGTGGGDYQTYDKGGIIGRTSSGLPIHAQANINNTKNFLYDDHKDAHHAHFTMAQYIKNMAQKKQVAGQDTSSLRGLYQAHMGFARHHNEAALKDMLHGTIKHVGSENLGARQERSGKTIVPMRNIPGSRVNRVSR